MNTTFKKVLSFMLVGAMVLSTFVATNGILGNRLASAAEPIGTDEAQLGSGDGTFAKGEAYTINGKTVYCIDVTDNNTKGWFVTTDTNGSPDAYLGGNKVSNWKAAEYKNNAASYYNGSTWVASNTIAAIGSSSKPVKLNSTKTDSQSFQVCNFKSNAQADIYGYSGKASLTVKTISKSATLQYYVDGSSVKTQTVKYDAKDVSGKVYGPNIDPISEHLNASGVPGDLYTSFDNTINCSEQYTYRVPRCVGRLNGSGEPCSGSEEVKGTCYYANIYYTSDYSVTLSPSSLPTTMAYTFSLDRNEVFTSKNKVIRSMETEETFKATGLNITKKISSVQGALPQNIDELFDVTYIGGNSDGFKAAYTVEPATTNDGVVSGNNWTPARVVGVPQTQHLIIKPANDYGALKGKSYTVDMRVTSSGLVMGTVKAIDTNVGSAISVGGIPMQIVSKEDGKLNVKALVQEVPSSIYSKDNPSAVYINDCNEKLKNYFAPSTTSITMPEDGTSLTEEDVNNLWNYLQKFPYYRGEAKYDTYFASYRPCGDYTPKTTQRNTEHPNIDCSGYNYYKASLDVYDTYILAKEKYYTLPQSSLYSETQNWTVNTGVTKESLKLTTKPSDNKSITWRKDTPSYCNTGVYSSLKVFVLPFTTTLSEVTVQNDIEKVKSQLSSGNFTIADRTYYDGDELPLTGEDTIVHIADANGKDSGYPAGFLFYDVGIGEVEQRDGESYWVLPETLTKTTKTWIRVGVGTGDNARVMELPLTIHTRNTTFVDSDAEDFYTWSDPNTGVTWKYRMDENSNVGWLYTTDREHIRNIITASKMLTLPNTINGIPVKGLGGGAGKPLIPAGYEYGSVSFPKGVEKINEEAFLQGGYKQTALTIPATVTAIDRNAFYGAQIKSVSFQLKDGGLTVASEAFAKAENLESVSFSCVDGASRPSVVVGGKAFSDLPSLTSLYFDENANYTIGKKAFEKAGLISLKLPNSVSFKADTSPFSHNDNLKYLVMDMSTVPANGFIHCDALSKVIFKENVQEVAYNWAGTEANTTDRTTIVLADPKNENKGTQFSFYYDGTTYFSPFGLGGNATVKSTYEGNLADENPNVPEGGKGKVTGNLIQFVGVDNGNGADTSLGLPRDVEHDKTRYIKDTDSEKIYGSDYVKGQCASIEVTVDKKNAEHTSEEVDELDKADNLTGISARYDGVVLFERGEDGNISVAFNPEKLLVNKVVAVKIGDKTYNEHLGDTIALEDFFYAVKSDSEDLPYREDMSDTEDEESIINKATRLLNDKVEKGLIRESKAEEIKADETHNLLYNFYFTYRSEQAVKAIEEKAKSMMEKDMESDTFAIEVYVPDITFSKNYKEGGSGKLDPETYRAQTVVLTLQLADTNTKFIELYDGDYKKLMEQTEALEEKAKKLDSAIKEAEEAKADANAKAEEIEKQNQIIADKKEELDDCMKEYARLIKEVKQALADVPGNENSGSHFAEIEKEVRKEEVKKDAEGNPIPVYEKDEQGNIKTGEDGNPIPVYEKDEEGNVKTDADGNPIPVYEKEVTTEVVKEKVIYIDGKPLPYKETEETTENGEKVYEVTGDVDGDGKDDHVKVIEKDVDGKKVVEIIAVEKETVKDDGTSEKEWVTDDSLVKEYEDTIKDYQRQLAAKMQEINTLLNAISKKIADIKATMSDLTMEDVDFTNFDSLSQEEQLSLVNDYIASLQKAYTDNKNTMEEYQNTNKALQSLIALLQKATTTELTAEEKAQLKTTIGETEIDLTALLEGTTSTDDGNAKENYAAMKISELATLIVNGIDKDTSLIGEDALSAIAAYNDKIAGALSTMSTKIATLQKANEANVKAIENKDTQIKELSDTIKKLEGGDNSGLMEQIDRLTKSNEELTEEIKKLNEDNASLQAQLAEANNLLRSIRTLLGVADNDKIADAIKALMEENAKNKATIAGIQNKLNTTANGADLIALVGTGNGVGDYTKTDVDKAYADGYAKGKAESGSITKDDLEKAKKTSYNEGYDAGLKANKNDSEQVTKLTKEVSDLTKENQTLTKDITDLETSIDSLYYTVAGTSSKKDGTDKTSLYLEKLNTINGKVTTIAKDRDVYQKKYDTVLQNHDALTKQYATLDKKYTSLNKDYTSLDEDYTSLNQKYTSLNKKYTSLKSKNSKLHTTISTLNSQVSSLKNARPSAPAPQVIYKDRIVYKDAPSTGSSSTGSSASENTTKQKEEVVEERPVYTVTFKDDDGETLKTAKYTEGAEIEYPENPEKDGYTFKQWSETPKKAMDNYEIVAQYEADMISSEYTVVHNDKETATDPSATAEESFTTGNSNNSDAIDADVDSTENEGDSSTSGIVGTLMAHKLPIMVVGILVCGGGILYVVAGSVLRKKASADDTEEDDSDEEQ